jgi:hypothetical protein
MTADKIIKYGYYGENIGDMPSLAKMIISI